MGKNRTSASSQPWCRGRLQIDSFSNVRDESRTITVRISVARERFLNKDLKTQFIKLKEFYVNLSEVYHRVQKLMPCIFHTTRIILGLPWWLSG